MIRGMNVESLTVPALQEGSRSREMRPRRVQEWLAQLPPGNAVERAQALEQVLAAQNRFALVPENRLELLELIRPVALEAGEGLQNAVGVAGLPTSERVRLAMAQWRRLEAELSFGYKRLLRERITGARHPARVAVIADLASRALEHLARTVRANCQIYQPYPDGAWAEIHAVYALVEHHGLAETRPADLADAATPLAAYLQVLLFGAANPYALMAGEGRRAADLLARMPLEARLSTDAPSNPPTAEFVISLGADAPPMAVPRGAPVNPDAQVRVLQTLPQVRVTHELVRQIEQGATPETLGLGENQPEEGLRELLLRLGRNWGLAARRHGGRSDTRGAVEVCLGLGAVHHYLAGGPAPSPVPVPPEMGDSDMFVDLDTLESTAQPAAVSTAADFEIQTWLRRNEGAEGLGLARQLNGTHDLLRVGELVGVRSASTRPWEVATVRWARHRAARLELGIHVLGPNARAVTVRHAADTENDWQNAVLLPASSALRRPETLLLPRSTFGIGDTLMLSEVDATPVRIRAIQLFDQTGSFDQCVFVRLDGGAAA